MVSGHSLILARDSPAIVRQENLWCLSRNPQAGAIDSKAGPDAGAAPTASKNFAAFFRSIVPTSDRPRIPAELLLNG
jgi:hypothetical protein